MGVSSVLSSLPRWSLSPHLSENRSGIGRSWASECSSLASIRQWSDDLDASARNSPQCVCPSKQAAEEEGEEPYSFVPGARLVVVLSVSVDRPSVRCRW